MECRVITSLLRLEQRRPNNLQTREIPKTPSKLLIFICFWNLGDGEFLQQQNCPHHNSHNYKGEQETLTIRLLKNGLFYNYYDNGLEI